MASLLQIRDAIAQLGSAEAQQLSQQLATPLPLVEAMLQQLTIMGKIEPVLVEENCSSGACKSCPEGQKCQPVLYRLRESG